MFLCPQEVKIPEIKKLLNYSCLTAVLCGVHAAQYEMTGASRRYGTSCSYDFFSNRITKTGSFFSPLYPRNYPSFSRCQYTFHGLPGEVVRLHFHRIQLDRDAARHTCVLSGDHASRERSRLRFFLTRLDPPNFRPDPTRPADHKQSIDPIRPDPSNWQ